MPLILTYDDIGRIYDGMPYGDVCDSTPEELTAIIQCSAEIKIKQVGCCDIGCCLYYTIAINGINLKENYAGEQSAVILTNCVDDSRDDNVTKIINELLQCSNMAIQIDDKSTVQEVDDENND